MWHRLRAILPVVILCLVLGFGLGMVVRAWTGPGAAPPSGNPAGGVTGSGTATRAAFWDGTSSLSSNANFYWDNTNSRLGIGLTNPATPIEVASGNVRVRGGADRVVIASNSAVGGKAVSLFAGGAESSLHYDSTSSFQILSNTHANIDSAIFGGTARLVIDSSGNVGIGMTPGAYKLDVNGTAHATDITCTDCLNAGDIAADAVTASELNSSGVTLGTYGNATNVPQITVDSDGRITAVSNVGISGGGAPGGVNTNVQFNNAGAFGGSGNLVWDNTNSRLGITGQLTMGNYETGAAFDIGSTAVDYPGNAGWPGTWNSNIVLSGLDSTSISFHDSGATAASFGHQANNFWLDGAGGWGPMSLGINTRTPGATLHVVGGARITGLVSCNTIDTNASGDLVCGTDETGAGGGVTGSGTVNTLPKWTPSTTALGNSQVTDDGTWVRMGGTLQFSPGGGDVYIGGSSQDGNLFVRNSSGTTKVDIDGFRATMKFYSSSANQDDGVMGAAPYGAGLNIVGINTDGGGRKINFWGSLIQNENPVGNSFSRPTSVGGQAVCTADGTGCPATTTTNANYSGDVWNYATCPAGYTLIGGGFYTSTGTPVVRKNYPAGGGQWGCHITGTGGSWTCYAVCIDTP